MILSMTQLTIDDSIDDLIIDSTDDISDDLTADSIDDSNWWLYRRLSRRLNIWRWHFWKW